MLTQVQLNTLAAPISRLLFLLPLPRLLFEWILNTAR